MNISDEIIRVIKYSRKSLLHKITKKKIKTDSPLDVTMESCSVVERLS